VRRIVKWGAPKITDLYLNFGRAATSSHYSYAGNAGCKIEPIWLVVRCIDVSHAIAFVEYRYVTVKDRANARAKIQRVVLTMRHRNPLNESVAKKKRQTTLCGDPRTNAGPAHVVDIWKGYSTVLPLINAIPALFSALSISAPLGIV
jgi:hypothetical protein